MAGLGGFDIKGLERLQKDLNKVKEAQLNEFLEACTKELAARLLAMIIKRTPVGDYDTYWTDSDGTRIVDDNNKPIVLKKFSKRGGTLRRGWTAQKGIGASDLNTGGVSQFIDSLRVNHFGDIYVIEVINSVYYASFVEFGHRTPDHKGWVKGQFMMTISEQELEHIAPKVLEKKITVFLGGVFR